MKNLKGIILGILAGSAIAAWAVGPVPFDIINLTTGLRIAGSATSGTYLRGNGTNYVSGAVDLDDMASGSATSAQLISILTDETGTGVAVFGTSPTIATPVLTGKIDRNNVAVDDDDCTGEQGVGWYDTTDSAFEFCNANSGTPVAVGSGGTPGGSDTQIQFNNAGVFGGEAAFTYDQTNNRIRGQTLTSASDGTLEMVQFSGTLPSSTTGIVDGMSLSITSAGSSANAQRAMEVLLNPGYTGSSTTTGISITNDANGTGATLNLGLGTGLVGNMGLSALAEGQGTGNTGIMVGIQGVAFNSAAQNFGVLGRATDNDAGSNIAILGTAANSTEATDLKNVGGYFTIDNTLITGVNVSVALIAQGDGTDDIFRGYDDTTLMFRMEDTGEFTSAGTSSIGWSVQAAANQACTTTCTNAAVVGFDATAGIVGPSDAAADQCLCAGAS